MAARWKHLPNEIAVDILSRLPPKTLIQFTSVSKSWYALIKNPAFVSAHLDRNIRNPSYYVLTANRNVCTLISDDSFIEHAAIEIPFHSPFSRVEVIGSCHGLVCFSRISPENTFQFKSEIFLWNPSIRKFKNLGQSDLILKKPSGHGFQDYVNTITVVGFGFCKDANDCRVVRIVYFKDGNRRLLGVVHPEVEVYCLLSDSWRRIDAKVPCLIRNAGLFFGGALHWLGASEDHLQWSIVSFDMKDEVFQQMMLPQVQIPTLNDAKLMELNGLLSLCACISDEMGSCCVWSMREYGVFGSWTKQITISSPRIPSSLSPFGFTKRGKPVYGERSTLLFAFDPENLQFDILGYNGPYTVDVAFMESLLLLD